MSWKLATFNVNGVRARLAAVLDWLQNHQPEVLCLQETKCQDKDFPFDSFREIGYTAGVRGQKAYNGVAVLTKTFPTEIRPGFMDGEPDEEARLIAVLIEGIWVVNTYIPQGRDPADPAFTSKLNFFSRLRGWFEKNFNPDQPLIWTGDLNVAPEPMDVFDPKHLDGQVGFHPAERRALIEAKSWGFVDVFRQLHPDQKQFSFWDYRLPKAFEKNLGWRLDHIMTTRPLARVCLECAVDTGPRGKPKPSDHTPVWAEFDL